MTQQFQVGDIVYVNPPSQKDLDFLDNIGLGDDIESYETKGIATHLTLVREGILRSCTFSDDVSDVLSGAHLPLVGSTVNNHERVEGVHLFPWGVRIDVTSTDGTSSSIGITVPLIEPALPFTTF